MDIAILFATQRNLRRAEQIPRLVEAIQRGEKIPPIRLSEADDGTIQVDDGHHRLIAYRLSGRTHLEQGEYELRFTDKPRPRFGRLSDLLESTWFCSGHELIGVFLPTHINCIYSPLA
jgi:hypothetical protein